MVRSLFNRSADTPEQKKQFRRLYTLNIIFNQVAILPYIISGIFFMRGDLNGLYRLLAMVFSIIKASLDAWVLLIEINR